MMATKRKEAKVAPLLLAVCFFLLPSQGRGAVDNVDRLEPVVRKTLDPQNPDEFGFSVALHQVKEPQPGNFSDALASTRYVFEFLASYHCGFLVCMLAKMSVISLV